MISRRRMLVATGALTGTALWPRLSGAADAARAPNLPPSANPAAMANPAASSNPAVSANIAATANAGPRRIALVNLHTNERLEIEYFRNDAYVTEALAAIEVLLRDFRNGEKHAIDPKLMDFLVDVADQVGASSAYSVISGYRSLETNEALHERSSGVSQRSLHMQGRAVDVRMSGVSCADLAARAEGLKRGGVGYYRASNFVHLDTGAFRTWRG